MYLGKEFTKQQMCEYLDDLANVIQNNNIMVRFFPYRTATLKSPLFWTDENPYTNLSQHQLAKLSKNEVDNHTVYELKDSNGKIIYVEFSDHHIGLGTQIYYENGRMF